MIFLIVSAVIAVFVWFVFIYPVWRVWASQKAGEADLQQAHKEQQIQVSKAQGRFDAAKINKEAAIIEAEAVSAQIEKIGKQLTEHDLYLKWQWIKMMEERPDSSVIYVPTEANLPILEAGMRRKKELAKEEE
jgi:regulator of protease activity HflC (stomatin/prohibitin superfamily)